MTHDRDHGHRHGEGGPDPIPGVTFGGGGGSGAYWKVEDGSLVVDNTETGAIDEVYITNSDLGSNFLTVTDTHTTVASEENVNILAGDGDVAIDATNNIGLVADDTITLDAGDDVLIEAADIIQTTSNGANGTTINALSGKVQIAAGTFMDLTSTSSDINITAGGVLDMDSGGQFQLNSPAGSHGIIGAGAQLLLTGGTDAFLTASGGTCQLQCGSGSSDAISLLASGSANVGINTTFGDVETRVNSLIVFSTKQHLTYTPTIGGGWTRVNGTVDGRYRRIGKYNVIEGMYTIGSSDTFGAGLTIAGLPVAPVVYSVKGLVSITDVSTGDIYDARYVIAVSATTGTIHFIDTSGAAAKLAPLSATAPFTFATGDTIQWQLEFERS